MRKINDTELMKMIESGMLQKDVAGGNGSESIGSQSANKEAASLCPPGELRAPFCQAEILCSGKSGRENEYGGRESIL